MVAAVGLTSIVLLLPLTIAYARRLWKRGSAAVAAVPAEASAQALRCFAGETGTTTIRAGRRTVELTPYGAATVYFEVSAALRSAARLARAVRDAGGIEEANEVLKRMGVRTELDYERAMEDR